jgi:hypothetical protein
VRPRTALLTTAAIAAALLAAAVPARADDGAPCPPAELSQPFAPWLDPAQYGLVPGGDFESGAAGWNLAGAQLVNENEPFHVTGPQDGWSLELGDGGSAVTPDVCLGIEDPTLRFFARNDGSPLSALAVSVRWTAPGGATVGMPLGVVAAGDWRPSQQIPVVLNLLSAPLLSDGSMHVRFAFTPIGPGGDWAIDDVYLDPFKTK